MSNGGPDQRLKIHLARPGRDSTGEWEWSAGTVRKYTALRRNCTICSGIQTTSGMSWIPPRAGRMVTEQLQRLLRHTTDSPR